MKTSPFSHKFQLISFIAGLTLIASCGSEGKSANSDIHNAASQSQNQTSPAKADTPQTTKAKLADGNFFISAANPYAVEAGAQILRDGGSAVDAAIATQAVLGLVEPQSSGLGGGAFMLYFDPAKGILETYDGREMAPASATPDRFLNEDGQPMRFRDAVIGGLSIGVPGVVRMLERAHRDHGAMDWSEPWQSTATLAEEGFAVSPRLNGLLERFSFLKQSPAAAAYFYDADGKAHPVGHTLKNPAYAQTVRAIANGGADAFYQGEIAQSIVDAVNNGPRPGGMTLEDIANYRTIKRAPVCGEYRDYEICSMAPPSSGGVTTLQILMQLERFNMRAAGAHTIEALHLLLESSRLAYADRNSYLADQDQTAAAGGLSQEELIAGLLNPAYVAARSQLINPDIAAEEVSEGDPSQYVIEGTAGKWNGYAPGRSPEPPSTSHFTIVDGKGRVVSMTTTVETVFGSNQMAGGMILNNQLTDFSFIPERNGVPVANAVAPGKRPRSSMSPVIMFDGNGELFSAIGSPGGPAIIGYVVKTLIAMIDWDMGMQDAIDLPHAVIPRGGAILEKDGYDEATLEGLTQKGHQVSQRALTSGLHGFKLNPDGTYDGGADKRREGIWITGKVGETGE